MAENVSFTLDLKVGDRSLDIKVLNSDDRQSLVDRVCRTYNYSEEYKELFYEKITTCLQKRLTKDLEATLIDKVMKFLEKGRVPEEFAETADKISSKYEGGSEWRSSYESIFEKREGSTPFRQGSTPFRQGGNPLRQYNSNIPKPVQPEPKYVKSAEVSREVSRYRPPTYNPSQEPKKTQSQAQPQPSFQIFEQRSKLPAMPRETSHLQSGTYRQLEHIPELSALEELTNRPQRRPSTNHNTTMMEYKHAVSERPRTVVPEKTNTTFIRANNKKGYFDYKPPVPQKNYREIVGQRYSRTARTMPHHTRPEPSSKLQLASRQANLLLGGPPCNPSGNNRQQLQQEDRQQHPIKRHVSTEKYEKRNLTNTDLGGRKGSTSVAVMRRFKYLSENDYQSYYL